MGTPQIIWLLLVGIGLGVDIARHGQPRKGTHSAGTSAVGLAVAAALLYWGGFFG